MTETCFTSAALARFIERGKKELLHTIKIFSLLCAPILLVGCLLSTPDSRFYLLEIPSMGAPISAKKINIAVQDVTVPGYLDRPQIVLQRPDSPELKISEFDRWASDLNTMVQNILIDDLQNAMPKAIIKRLAYGTNPRYIVKLNVERMGGWLGEQAYLRGNWQILSPSGRILYEQNINRKRDVGKTYASYVEAQSMMLSETGREIALKIAAM